MTTTRKIVELVCPECKSETRDEGDSLVCLACQKVYEIRNGIPCMLDVDMKAFAEEIAVQDQVACGYEKMRYHDPYARRYHYWWVNEMLKDIPAGGRLLDNGCGIGMLTDKKDLYQIVGLDISSQMLKYASKNYDQLILGNSQKLPFSNGSFDVVFCRSLIHHLPEPQMAVKEIHRVLRPGGAVVFADTNTSLISMLPRIIANKGKHFSDDHKNLSKKVIEQLLKPSFTTDRIEYFGYLAYPLLGFPDLLNIFKYVPYKNFAERCLMAIDQLLSKIPLARTQSWGIIVKASKPVL